MGLNSVMAMSIRRDAERLLGIELWQRCCGITPRSPALTVFLADKLVPEQGSDDDQLVTESDGSVLDELFGSVESTLSAKRV